MIFMFITNSQLPPIELIVYNSHRNRNEPKVGITSDILILITHT